MKIIFNNNETVQFELIDSPLREYIQKCFKHLQHIPLDFHDFQNPYYTENIIYAEHVLKLKNFAEKLSIIVNIDNLHGDSAQSYCNHLHELYEKNYDGKNHNWLIFHEMIHLCEDYYKPSKNVFFITYDEKAGYFNKPYDHEYTKNLTTIVKRGDIFITWAELGKKIYRYWKDGEPNDINRIKELIKPWLIIKPQLNIALTNCDLFPNIDVDKFNSWWNQYKEEWLTHHNIPDWTLENTNGVIIVGKIQDIDKVDDLLKNNINPQYVKLK